MQAREDDQAVPGQASWWKVKEAQMTKTVVITGSTRGLGFGLAADFLRQGHQVVVSGRAQSNADAAAARLLEEDASAGDCILSHACDVRDYSQVQSLWDAAVERFGRVDVWINNAAVATAEVDFTEHDPETIDAILDTNLSGTLFGCHVAARGMLDQGGGFIYNMEGWGSRGESRAGSTLYGSSKAGAAYFTKTLERELADTSVRLASINPGMVMTEMLVDSTRPGREENMRRIINILGDSVDTVSPWLVQRILENDRHGARITWLKPAGVLWRFLTARFRSRKIADDIEFLDKPAQKRP
ncbi:MAG: SDR family oxidoreductase [Wenzhouxiangella sp.]|jgi:NAD(P)-dependent dehydrogenase (short-subunit alcohol dehydrogenase family)|nr:SDR family oxidoreductase [Wenzhouxiangella sp.]